MNDRMPSGTSCRGEGFRCPFLPEEGGADCELFDNLLESAYTKYMGKDPYPRLAACRELYPRGGRIDIADDLEEVK